MSARGLAVRESALEELLAFFRGEFRRFVSARGMDATERRGEESWLFGGEATPGAMEWFLREEADRGPSLPVQFEAVDRRRARAGRSRNTPSAG